MEKHERIFSRTFWFFKWILTLICPTKFLTSSISCLERAFGWRAICFTLSFARFQSKNTLLPLCLLRSIKNYFLSIPWNPVINFDCLVNLWRHFNVFFISVIVHRFAYFFKVFFNRVCKGIWGCIFKYLWLFKTKSTYSKNNKF